MKRERKKKKKRNREKKRGPKEILKKRRYICESQFTNL
jgi:hypothetical protein